MRPFARQAAGQLERARGRRREAVRRPGAAEDRPARADAEPQLRGRLGPQVEGRDEVQRAGRERRDGIVCAQRDPAVEPRRPVAGQVE
jgi:hypothetical protein